MAPYFDGSINGSGPGLAIDDAGFGSCAWATFVDRWSGPGHAELDDACVTVPASVAPMPAPLLLHPSASPTQLSRLLESCAPRCRRLLGVSLIQAQDSKP